ncbi:hypothetical protein ACWDSL_49130 [Streptomyces sp. NPDC000941]
MLLDAAGRASHRRPATRISIDGVTAVLRSRAQWPQDAKWDPFGGPDTSYVLGPWITVGSALRGSIEVRAVRVDPAAGDEPTGHVLRIGGWSLAVDPQRAPCAAQGATARVAGVDGLISSLPGAHGLPTASVAPGEDSNALGAASATPVVQTDGPVVYGTLHVALVHLGGSDPAALPRITTRAEGTTLVADVTWADDAQDAIRLPAAEKEARKDQHRA